MTLIRRKPEVIEAVQWLGRFACRADWPAWYLEAEESGHIELMGKELKIRSYGRVIRVHLNDWIWLPGNELVVIRSADFDEHFELVVEGE